MIDRGLRVRVDVLAGEGGRWCADVLLPAEVPVADLLPELVASAAGAGAAGAPAGARWRLRLPTGAVADPERGLAAAGVRDGDRLTLVDDPGPAPPPLVVDAADLLAAGAAAPVDAALARVVALAGLVPVLAGVLALSRGAAGPAAAAAGLLCAVLALGLAAALARGAGPAAAATAA
ncbi:EsaB/YukD family protein, partial [Corynebacterium sphenisci]|uniref:EsaB/YukD family protein n=1 Tax=Corynebacterium sphenisci TaxID=191493 RepID=UPI0026DEF80D